MSTRLCRTLRDRLGCCRRSRAAQAAASPRRPGHRRRRPGAAPPPAAAPPRRPTIRPTRGRSARTCRRGRRTASRTSRACIVAIPLPRNVETPLVPMANRAANRANGEFSYSLNERPKLPEGAIVRPAGVDPADGKIPLKPEALAKRKEIIANQEKIEHLDGRVLCLRARRSAQHDSGAGRRLSDLPEARLRRHLLRAEPSLSDDSARRPSAARSEHPQGDGRVARTLGGQYAGRRGDQLHEQPREQLGHRRGLRDARRSGGVADHRARNSAQRRVSGDRALHADRRQHDPLRGDDQRSRRCSRSRGRLPGMRSRARRRTTCRSNTRASKATKRTCC